MTVPVQQFSGPLPTQADIPNYEINANRFMTEFPAVITSMNAQNVENNALNTNVNAKNAESVTAAATAVTQAGIATTQAGIATTAATTATTKAAEAVVSAGEADDARGLAVLAQAAAEDARDMALGAGPWPSGTRMLFAQQTAPVSWTRLLIEDNAALRVVSGTAPWTAGGGVIDFTSAFTNQTVSGSVSGAVATGSINSVQVSGTVEGTVLSTAHMPAHNHDYTFWDTDQQAASGTGAWRLSKNGKAADVTGARGGGAAHNHAFTGGWHAHTFTGNSHSHTLTGTTLDLRVKYVNVIVAEKD